MPDYGNLPANYAGTPFPDGAKGSLVTIGRHSKWGYLSVMGPDAKEYTIGLAQSMSVTETNNSEFIPQAGSDWLELQIGSRMWRASLSRQHVRGADIKQMMRRIYPNISDVDFRYLPFIWKYNFSYKPPIGLTKAYEDATWVFHKAIITTYSNNLVPGPNNLLTETCDIIMAGEQFSEGGAEQYKSNPIVWGGGTYDNQGAGQQHNPVTGVIGANIPVGVGPLGQGDLIKQN